MKEEKDLEKLEELRKLEIENGMVEDNEPIEEKQSKTIQFESSQKNEQPTIIDGYKILENYDLPNEGKLYPDNWRFAYRCPTTKEVANFSTVQNNDTPAIISATEELIKKCVKIIDIDTGGQIPSTEINDGDRLFFIVKLRDFYLPGSPIKYDNVCEICHEQYEVILNAESLIYEKLNDKLLSAFDGRVFTLDFGLDEPITFYIPTIGNSSKIFKYIVKVYRDQQNGDSRNSKEDKIAYDKNFLLLAPYLFQTGKESIKEIIQKYKEISKDNEKFNAYLNIANKIKLDNLETIDYKCPHCESTEEAQIKFPGGWNKMFIGKDVTGYFD